MLLSCFKNCFSFLRSDVTSRRAVLSSTASSAGALDLSSFANLIAKSDARVVVMAGAGVSVSAGIPDFRTPGTGLYDNLQEYGLPYPEAM
jgi:NAD-dependent deacetylase sirtuin 2